MKDNIQEVGKMTKEEILAMEAGRELDALVDKGIFSGNGCVHDLYWVDPDEYVCSKCHKQFVSPEPWAYSTDIAATWQAVDKMREELFSTRRRFLKALQYLTVTRIEGTGETGMIAWPDVFWLITPEAICRAALLAKLEIT